jgi:hypothetical protein
MNYCYNEKRFPVDNYNTFFNNQFHCKLTTTAVINTIMLAIKIFMNNSLVFMWI